MAVALLSYWQLSRGHYGWHRSWPASAPRRAQDGKVSIAAAIDVGLVFDVVHLVNEIPVAILRRSELVRGKNIAGEQ